MLSLFQAYNDFGNSLENFASRFVREIHHALLSSNIMAPKILLTHLSLEELPCNGPFVLETECGYAAEYSIQLYSTLQ